MFHEVKWKQTPNTFTVLPAIKRLLFSQPAKRLGGGGRAFPVVCRIAVCLGRSRQKQKPKQTRNHAMTSRSCLTAASLAERGQREARPTTNFDPPGFTPSCGSCRNLASQHGGSLDSMSDDQLASKHTAFSSMEALLTAKGGYFPSLRTLTAKTSEERLELGQLADAYDAYQYARSDSRRAFRC